VVGYLLTTAQVAVYSCRMYGQRYQLVWKELRTTRKW